MDGITRNTEGANDMGYLESYRAWRASPAVDAETKRELAAIAGDPAVPNSSVR